MKQSKEIRSESWQIMRKGKWALRYLWLTVVLGLTTGVINGVLTGAIQGLKVQGWGDFLLTKAQTMMASGMSYAVPSSRVAWQMTGASAFRIFITCILWGICTWGLSNFFLRAAEDKNGEWFKSSFGGFKRPLGVGALYFRWILQILLWGILFLPLAFVAIYRYCQCWNLKVEHPEWSAGKCLKESARMMKGNKYRRFALDCSYWRPITLSMLPLLAIAILLRWVEISANCELNPIILSVILACYALAMVLILVTTVYMTLGQTRFYLELREDEVAREALAPDEDA